MKVGLACIQDDANDKAYLEHLAKRYPQEKQRIQTVQACYKNPQESGECVDRVLGGKQGAYSLGINNSTRYICRDYAELSAEAAQKKWDSYKFIEQTRVWLKAPGVTHEEIPAGELKGLDELLHFYYRSNPRSFSDLVKKYLRRPPFVTSQRIAFEGNKTTPTEMNPPICKKDSDKWKLHHVTIEGLPYQIPVLVPKSNPFPWWLHEDLVTSYFEGLKTFLHPDDLEKILKPGKYPNFSLLISGDMKKDPELYENCDIDINHNGGLYNRKLNRVHLVFNYWSLSAKDYQGQTPLDPLIAGFYIFPSEGLRVDAFWRE